MKTPEPHAKSDFFDPILDEVYRIKIELSARFNHDVHAIARDARVRQAQSGHQIITEPLRKPTDPSPPQG